MKIEILNRNIDDQPKVREYIRRKVHFAIDRIDSRIKRVTVRLEDETKDSPAFDGRCQIEVEMKPRGHIHVSSNGDTVFDCVLKAVRKMEHAVKHEIDRQRRSSKVRHQKTKRAFIDSLPAEPGVLSLEEPPTAADKQ